MSSMVKGVNFKISAVNAAGPAIAGFNRGLNSMRSGMGQTSTLMRSWNAGLNSNRRAVQQFGFQMSDFAIQIAGGQSALLAFTQQGGQMLQFFGPAGAVLAALLAVFGSLALGITRSGVALNSLFPYFGVLEQEMRGLVDSLVSVYQTLGTVGRFLIDNLDLVVISAMVAAGFFATRWVASMLTATAANSAFGMSAGAAGLASLRFAGAMAIQRAGIIITTAATWALATVQAIFSARTWLAVAATIASAGSMSLATTGTALWTGALGFLQTALYVTVGALTLLKGALIATGIGAIIVLVGYLIERFLTLARGAGGFGNALVLLKDVAAESFGRMGIAMNYLGALGSVVAANINMVFIDAFMNIAQSFQGMINGIIDGINSSLHTSISSVRIDLGSNEGLGGRSPGDRTGVAGASFDALDALDAARGVANGLRNDLAAPMTSIAALQAAIAAGDGSGIPPGGVPGAVGAGGAGGDPTGAGAAAAAATDAAADIETTFDNMRKSIGASMLSSFKALTQGTKSFAEAAFDMLSSVADKVIDILMTPIFNNIAGSLANGILGGLGGLGATVPTAMPSFEGGGNTWTGPRAGGLDGRGGRLAMLHSDESVTDHRSGESGTGGQNVYVTMNITTPDAQSFRKSRSQIQAELAQAVRAGAKGN